MAEDQYMSAGSAESVFELDGVTAASVICYDIRFPEWVLTQMAQGAKVLFVVAQWPEPRVQQWEILLRARAVENQAFVVAVNRVGTGRAMCRNAMSLSMCSRQGRKNSSRW